MKKIMAISGLLFLLISCTNGKNKLILKSSTGRINSILVVIDNSNWTGNVGITVKDILSNPVKGLPQPENQFSVTHIKPNLFNSLFQSYRNILVIGTASIAKYEVKRDVYASPQIIMTIIGKNESDLINKIRLHKQDILNIYKSGDLALYQQKLAKKLWPKNSFKEVKNINIPTNYLKVENTPNFLWLRKHLSKDGMINVLSYKTPVNQQDTLDLSYIINERNRIGKMHIPGQFKNTYMQTSTTEQPTISKINVNDNMVYVTRGLWEVKNDFMGGPFVNYTFVDKTHNQLICFDGFVYSPNQNKRDYIFELEAIFRTFKLK